ncbi:thiamine diphosphate carrier 2 [Scenedesmus sp. PABB004]|nr:thiamine diphosphate carrier 2 [Scenedesmus sp. PABB004]
MHVPSSADGAGEEAGGGPPPRRRVALDAAAGALAGAVSRFMVGPLDVVKIRFQVQLEPIAAAARRGGGAAGGAKAPSHYTGFVNAFRTIVAEEGLRGLWTGTVPGLLLTIPYTAVQFVALQQCKETAARLGWDGRSSTAVSFASGALAGAAATVASYPFDLLRTTLAAQGEPKARARRAPLRAAPRRLGPTLAPLPRPTPALAPAPRAAAQVYKGMRCAARAIVGEHGPAGLYRGLGVTLVEIMPYAALQFGLYDALNRAWDAAAARRPRGDGAPQHGRPRDGKLQAFACGLAAGLLAKLGSHPLDVAKKRYQVAGLPRSLRYGARVERTLAATPLLACLADIHAREGLAGLWKGSVPSLVKAAPAAAITFTAYEAFIGLLLAAAGHGGGGGGADGAAGPEPAAEARQAPPPRR